MNKKECLFYVQRSLVKYQSGIIDLDECFERIKMNVGTIEAVEKADATLKKIEEMKLID